MNNFMIKRILLEREIIKSLYRFVNSDVIQKSHADKLFNERVGNIIYTATPNFIIETDSELELPEKYLSK